MEKEYLIVGAGIAGLSIAHELIKQDKKVRLLDHGNNVSSKIAAGIINPVVFKRLTKSWMIDEEIPVLVNFYLEIEHLLKIKVLNKLNFRRFFGSEFERDLWEKKKTDPELKEYIQLENMTHFDELINEDFGSGYVNQAYRVDVELLINAYQSYFLNAKQLSFELFDFGLLDSNAGLYRNIDYEKIIFCQGYENIHNPFFQKFPVETTKGEVLEVAIPNLKTTDLLNRKCWIAPKHGDEAKYQIGSTYTWETPDTIPTIEAKNELLEKAQAILNTKIQILDHKAGIRPTTPDRRPIIGIHPVFEKLVIFNGLGTKGFSHAPLCAKELAMLLVHGIEMNSEVKIERHFKKLFSI